jgi:hypothetical protein
MKKNLVILLLMFCLGTQVIHAQNKLSIDKVYSVVLRNSGPIVEAEQIKGYYFFYQSDKIDKKTNEYTLQILDENLNKVKDIKFNDSKTISLLESSYNGSSMMFAFYDNDQNMLDYRIYNLDGKKSFTYSKPLDKLSESYFRMLLAQKSEDEGDNQNLFDINAQGFLALTPMRENKKYTYEVSFYGSGKKKTWTYNPLEDGKYMSAQYLGSNDSVALLEVLKKEKLMSKDLESTLVGINLATGKKAFEIRTQDGSRQLYPMNLSTLNGNNREFLLIGPYYQGTERVMQDKSDGLGIWLMNNQGKIVNSKYNSWAGDISKFIKVDQKGKVGDLGFVFFHNMMQTEDGKFFAIGEGYKKTANALGIAAAVATRSYNSNMTKLVVTDMLMLQFNEKFEVTAATIYEKNNNNFSIPGSDFSNPHTLAIAAKTYGAFDYTYTQPGKNKASFVSGYTDYERSKDYKGMTFNSISYYDGAITNDKINLKTSASSIRILPAKPGSVLLVEYFKKDKRLDLRLEKIN